MPCSRRLPNPGIEPRSPALQVDSLPLSHQGSPGQPLAITNLYLLILSTGRRNTQDYEQNLADPVSGSLKRNDGFPIQDTQNILRIKTIVVKGLSSSIMYKDPQSF